ncbi:MAG: tyrosine-type recombinase/integrase [Candidatus Scalinduaceae bacterium]
MKSDYKITRDKFMDDKERDKLIRFCKEKAELDLMKGRITWVVRNMLVNLVLYSGLRVSEIAKLKIKDLHLNKVDDPYLFVRNGKRDKDRDVYLDKRLVKELKKYIAYKKKTLKESVEPEAPFLAGRGGKHSTATALQISFKKAIEDSGLNPRYSIHSARHTYGTHLYHTTKNLRFVQKQLGHSNITMTSLYADILPSENGKLANLIRNN